MATKQELLNEIDQLVSQYLGFPTSVYGMKSKRKQDIEIYAHNMRRAVLYKTLAQDYKPTTNETLVYSICGEYTAQYLFWAYLTEVAHLLYYGEIENIAADRAYNKVYGE